MGGENIMTMAQLQEKVAGMYKFETDGSTTIRRKIVDEIVGETVAVLRDERLISIAVEEEEE
jgi:hypothetical protein